MTKFSSNYSKKKEEREKREMVTCKNRLIKAQLFIEYAKMDDITLKSLCNLLHIKATQKDKAIKELVEELTNLDELYTKPRKLELHRHNGGFIVLFYHGNWEIMPFIIPMFVQANDKLTALIEGFCYEAERQLK